MNHKKMRSLYGIKWNPFAKDVPVEGIIVDKPMEDFCWQVENLVMDGGFAMITGPVGTGKSVALRWLASRLEQLKDVHVAEFCRPQSSLADFYRELSSLFGLGLQVSNRFTSFRSLREKWVSHIESSLFRPVLIIDEAQEMPPAVLSELRLMASSHFDSKSILTVVLAGDERLPSQFRNPDLVPLGSRIKTRLTMEHKGRDELGNILVETMRKAGNPSLLSKDLLMTLADRSMGNYRAMMQMAEDLLIEGMKREITEIDQKLFLERFDMNRSKLERKRRK